MNILPTTKNVMTSRIRASAKSPSAHGTRGAITSRTMTVRKNGRTILDRSPAPALPTHAHSVTDSGESPEKLFLYICMHTHKWMRINPILLHSRALVMYRPVLSLEVELAYSRRTGSPGAPASPSRNCRSTGRGQRSGWRYIERSEDGRKDSGHRSMSHPFWAGSGLPRTPLDCQKAHRF